MRQSILLLSCLVLLATGPSPAHGSGYVFFHWGEGCDEYTGPSIQNYHCMSNTASVSWPATVSFSLDFDFPDMVGYDMTLEGCTSSDVLPDWWRLDPEGCRAGMFAFTASDASSEAGCFSWTGQPLVTDVTYTPDALGGAVIQASASLPPGAPPVSLDRLFAYYAGRITFLNGRTIGTDACAGCSQDFIWALTRLRLHGSDGRTESIGFVSPIVWQAGVPGYPTCGVTATRDNTWGQIKSMYR